MSWDDKVEQSKKDLLDIFNGILDDSSLTWLDKIGLISKLPKSIFGERRAYLGVEDLLTKYAPKLEPFRQLGNVPTHNWLQQLEEELRWEDRGREFYPDLILGFICVQVDEVKNLYGLVEYDDTIIYFNQEEIAEAICLWCKDKQQNIFIIDW